MRSNKMLSKTCHIDHQLLIEFLYLNQKYFWISLMSVQTCVYKESCSAIDLSLWNISGYSDGSFVVSPYLEESTFVNNTVKYTKFYGTPTGIDAVYTDSVPLDFTAWKQ